MFGKGMGNMAGMMKKVQKMQEDMKKMQEELKTRTVEASVGGGAVTVVMNGEKIIESLKLNPTAVDPEDVEMLEDLVMAAVNEASKKVDDLLAQEMGKAKGATRHCSICFNLSAQDPCEFCSNPNRDQTTIMVVETSRDVIAIERSGDYKGLYHVLEGALSPMEGIGADDIRVKELIARLRDGVVQEVILATDPDVEGEATALYLARLLSPSGIKVTRIARGVPVGGDIEYADELTLGGAVVNRQEMKG